MKLKSGTKAILMLHLIHLLKPQISGLQCVVSDVITTEVDLGDRVYRLSLSKKPLEWANKVLSLSSSNRSEFYDINENKIRNYDIFKTVEDLTTLYNT